MNVDGDGVEEQRSESDSRGEVRSTFFLGTKPLCCCFHLPRARTQLFVCRGLPRLSSRLPARALAERNHSRHTLTLARDLVRRMRTKEHRRLFSVSARLWLRPHIAPRMQGHQLTVTMQRAMMMMMMMQPGAMKRSPATQPSIPLHRRAGPEADVARRGSGTSQNRHKTSPNRFHCRAQFSASSKMHCRAKSHRSRKSSPTSTRRRSLTKTSSSRSPELLVSRAFEA